MGGIAFQPVWQSGVLAGIKMEGEAPPDPAAVAAAAAAKAATDAAAAAAAARPQEPAWATARIDELTRLRREAERTGAETKTQLDLANAELEKFRKGAPPDMVPKSEVEKLAKEEAKKLAAQQTFDTTCNQVVAIGKKAFADWDNTIANFSKIGGLDPNLVAAAIEAGSGEDNPIAATAAVLHKLGSDLNEASKVLNMPVTRQVAHLTRMAGASKVKAVPDAPEPIEGVRHTTLKQGASVYDAGLTPTQFMELRNKEVADKRKTG